MPGKIRITTRFFDHSDRPESPARYTFVQFLCSSRPRRRPLLARAAHEFLHQLTGSGFVLSSVSHGA